MPTHQRTTPINEAARRDPEKSIVVLSCNKVFDGVSEMFTPAPHRGVLTPDAAPGRRVHSTGEYAIHRRIRATQRAYRHRPARPRRWRSDEGHCKPNQ